MDKFIESLKHHAGTVLATVLGVLLLIVAGFIVRGGEADGQIAAPLWQLYEIAIGMFVLAIASLVLWFTFGRLFPTINWYINRRQFPFDWDQTTPGVRVCVTIGSVLALAYILVYALKP